MSAAGGYIDDAKSRGMNDKQAYQYGTVMGTLEGASEAIITGQQLNKITKAFTGKEINKEILNSYGFNIFENAIQEAVMEPAQEITAGIVGNKADWTDMGSRMLESGFNGALMGAISNGATYGLEKSGIVYNKVKNGEMVTQTEYNEALQENIDRFGKDRVEASLRKGANEVYQEINKVANSESSLYNGSESESGRYEQSNKGTQEANLGGDISESRVFEERKLQQYTEQNYREWEQSIVAKSESELTSEEIKLKQDFKERQHKDIVFIKSDNGKGYNAGASLNEANKIYIKTDEARKFGLNRTAFHETMESNIRFANETTRDIIMSTIEDIVSDTNFENQKIEFWKNQEGEIPNNTAIAKDIICDKLAELNGEILDYKNILSDEINNRIDMSIEYFNKELENSSSFNLPVKEGKPSKSINVDTFSNTKRYLENTTNMPTREYFENQRKIETLTDTDYEVLNKIYEKEGKTQILTEKRKAKILEKYASDKFRFKDSIDTIAQKITNKGHYVDKLAESTRNLELKYAYDRNLNSFAEGQYVVGVAQTDNQGNSIGKSIEELWRPAEEAKLSGEFAEYLLHLLNIDRSEKHKYVFGEDIGPAESTKIALTLEKKHLEFKSWAKDIKEFNHNNLNNLKEAGLLTQDNIDYLERLYPNYVPILRDNESGMYVGNNDKTGTASPIKRATGGNADIQPLKDTMAMQAIRIKRLINQNRLGQELAKSLKSAKIDNTGVSFTPGALMDMDSFVEADGSGKKYYTYFENGELQKLEINDNLYESLKPTEISKIEKTLPFRGLQKLTNINRSLLTTSNPLFIVTNFFKDLQDGMFNSKYSSKFVKNYGKALNEIMTKGKYYESYMANGGMTNSYFDYNEGIKKKSNRFVERIRNANEIVEQLPRLAEFISTLEDGRSLNEALYNAAEITTNFKRGGEWTKALNRNGATFLNASVQGLDKFYRNFSGQNGAKGYVNLAIKATLMAVVPAVLNHILLDDDEDYQDLPQSTKDLYYLFKYDDGKFIRIPKRKIFKYFWFCSKKSNGKRSGAGRCLERF